MTSGTGSRTSGFSLLEILIVFSIILLFAGFFALRFDDSHAEQVLAESSVALKTASLKAKRRSFAFRRDHYIVFNLRGFRVTERISPDEASIGGFDQDPDDAAVFKRFALPEGVKMEVLPSGQEKWVKPNGFVWVFRDSGLSDPLSVRFSSGTSYTKLSFNVLTGLAEEETVIQ